MVENFLSKNDIEILDRYKINYNLEFIYIELTEKGIQKIKPFLDGKIFAIALPLQKLYKNKNNTCYILYNTISVVGVDESNNSIILKSDNTYNKPITKAEYRKIKIECFLNDII